MNTNKKGKNPILSTLISAGQNSEQNLVNVTLTDSSKDENLKNDIETNISTEELPEKKREVDSSGNVGEQELPEKTGDSICLDNKKKEYANIIKVRNQKGSVEKANLFTQHRDLLKKIATAENISMQDLLANIIDNFQAKYQPEIKASVKKLML